MGRNKNQSNDSLKVLSPDVVIIDEALAMDTNNIASDNNDLEIIDTECVGTYPTTPWTAKEYIQEALQSIPNDNPFKNEIVRDLRLISQKLD